LYKEKKAKAQPGLGKKKGWKIPTPKALAVKKWGQNWSRICQKPTKEWLQEDRKSGKK